MPCRLGWDWLCLLYVEGVAVSTRTNGRTAQTRRRKERLTRSLAMLLLALVLALASLAASIVPFTRAPKEEAAPTAPQATPAPSDDEPSDEPAETKQSADDAARAAFVSTWAERIDAFNAGYPLEGYGATFAEAAYDCGVDPRFAPAIARVESGSGANCTYSCNAWGWGSSSWGDWDTAIWEYTAALGAAYGSTLSYEAALSYNEVTPDAWYAEVEASMYQIWESNSL